MQRASATDASPAAGSSPLLPIKQTRSHSSQSFHDLTDVLHMYGPQPPQSPVSGVFDPPYCNDHRCPIHYQNEHHQVRFFSDQAPPPLPKKSSTRTFSLPVEIQDPTGTQKYENPIHVKTLVQGQLAGQEKVDQNQCFHTMTFDSNNSELDRFFRSSISPEQALVGIQEHYVLFLKTAQQKIEKQVYLDEHHVKMVKTSQPEDFVLCGQQSNRKEAIYVVRCLKAPGRLLSAKVHQGNPAPDQSKIHPNVDQVLVSFCQTPTSSRSESHREPSSEPFKQTFISLLEDNPGVKVLRDVPLRTLEDFIQERHSLLFSQPDVHEKRVCLLFLQLVLSLQQLASDNVLHSAIKAQNVLLVWPSITRPLQHPGDRRNPNTGPSGSAEERRELCETLWEHWGTPRLVMSSADDDDDVFHEGTSLEFQVGSLLGRCLQSSSPHTHTPCLMWLVGHLTSENPKIMITEVVNVLRFLLWGPQLGLLSRNPSESSGLSNWLLYKQSLLVLKLAEDGLFGDNDGLDWEDYLYMQYLSSVDDETWSKTSELVHSLC